jgi:putative ABC transport system permease protein
MVFSPNSFTGAPYNTLATLTNPPDSTAVDEAKLLAKVATRFPGVTSVRVKDALEAIDELVGKLIAAIRGASLVTLFSAILVLAGALGAGQQARIYDAVILKTLGATRAILIRAYVIEYAMIALFSAIFGLIAGDLLAQTIVTKLMKLGYHGLTQQSYGVALLGVIGTIGLGLVGTWRVLGQKPARHLHSL